jgi:hypothetical protein
MIAKQCHKMEVAHPTGFEPVTSAFGVRRFPLKSLINIDRTCPNEAEFNQFRLYYPDILRTKLAHFFGKREIPLSPLLL